MTIKRDKFFEQFNKIADVELRDRCKELYDDDNSGTFPISVKEAIGGMCDWGKTEEGQIYWMEKYNRTDLETNPYIILRWKPEVEKEYYAPNPCRTDKYNKFVWCNGVADNTTLERGLVFRTAEEAVSCTNKMLEAMRIFVK